MSSPEFDRILEVVRRNLQPVPHQSPIALELGKDLAGFRGMFNLDPSFDKRDPDPEKNYGISSAIAVITLVGPAGGTYFSFSTGWYLQHLFDELVPKGYRYWREDVKDRQLFDGPLGKLVGGKRMSMLGPMAHALGVHSPTPRYQNHVPQTRSCQITGGLCWGGERYSQAEEALETLIVEGSEALWAYLRGMYRGEFEEPNEEREAMAEWSKTQDWSQVRTNDEIPHEEKREQLRKAYNELRDLTIQQGGPIPPPLESFNQSPPEEP